MKQLRPVIIVACVLCLGVWLSACSNAAGQQAGEGAATTDVAATDGAGAATKSGNKTATGGDESTQANGAQGNEAAADANAKAADAKDAADAKVANAEGDAANTNTEGEAASDKSTEPAQPQVVSAGANAVTEKNVVSRKELAEPKEFVAFGDYPAMEAFKKAVDEGQKEGVVVQVDGIVAKLSDNEPYAIVQKSADGASQVGVTYFIEWIGDDSYPADGTHVVLSGKVIPDKSASGYGIHTTKEFVRVQP